MVSKLFLVLRIAVILFPTVSGVLLTDFGANKLNEAYIVPFTPRMNPHGFLIFSTMNLPKGSTQAHFWIGDISLEERTAKVHIYYEFGVVPPSTGEQVIGFQIPYFCDLLNFSIGSQSEKLEVSKIETVHLEDSVKDSTEKAKTTLIYAKFFSSPLIEKYSGDLEFTWEGSIIKEDFSNYIISIPLADSPGDSHEKVLEYCPNASIYFEDIRVIIAIQIPEDCEYKGSIIPPIQELAVTSQTQNSILWEITNPNIMGLPGSTYHFTMSLENNVESELRDHLLFDSGLYMGLGVSLVFGGLYEAIKILTDIVKERRKT
jgi:hypothetical protein